MRIWRLLLALSFCFFLLSMIHFYFYMCGNLPWAHTNKSMSCALVVLISVYLIWSFRHFRTTLSVEHPLERFLRPLLSSSPYFSHRSSSSSPRLRICRFGRQSILLLVGFLWVRESAEVFGIITAESSSSVSLAVTALTFLLSLLNMNAVLYLTPYFVYEMYRSKLL